MAMKKTISIEGMSCEHCVAHVREALEGLGGKSVEVNLSEGFATAELECADDAIISAIDDAGYDVISIE